MYYLPCSCLKAGLKTWKDHLERIAALEADRAAQTEAAEAELADVARAAAQCEEDVATHAEMRRQLELCQVGEALIHVFGASTQAAVFVSSFQRSRRDRNIKNDWQKVSLPYRQADSGVWCLTNFRPVSRMNI